MGQKGNDTNWGCGPRSHAIQVDIYTIAEHMQTRRIPVCHPRRHRSMGPRSIMPKIRLTSTQICGRYRRVPLLISLGNSAMKYSGRGRQIADSCHHVPSLRIRVVNRPGRRKLGRSLGTRVETNKMEMCVSAHDEGLVNDLLTPSSPSFHESAFQNTQSPTFGRG